MTFSTAARLPVRLATIEKLWPAGLWDAEGRRRGEAWDLRRTAYAVTFVCLWSMLDLELRLWILAFFPWLPTFAAALAPAWGSPPLFLLPPLLLSNAWLLDRYLADRTLEPPRVTRWLRIVRAAVLAVPVFGLWGIPAWSWIQERRPAWAFSHGGSSFAKLTAGGRQGRRPLQGAVQIVERWRRRWAASVFGTVLWMIVCQLLAFGLLQSWVAGDGSLWKLIGMSVLCHGFAFLGVSLYLARRRFRLDTSGGRGLRLRLAPFLILLPMPFPLLSFAFWLQSTEEAREEKTLIHAVHAFRHRRPAITRAKPSRGLELLGLGTAASSRAGVAGKHEERCRSFYRSKSFWLILDAAALVLLITSLGGKPFFSMQSSNLALIPFLALAAVGALIDLVSIVRAASRWFRRQPALADLPVGRFLAPTQLALPCGLLLGASVAKGHGGEVGPVLQVIGYVSFSAALLLFPIEFLLGRIGRIRTAALWLFLFGGIALWGTLVSARSDWAAGALHFFRWAALATPLVSLLLGWRFLRSLLHPFTRQDLTGDSLLFAVRGRLLFLTATALLPLGGVAVPLWLLLRRPLPRLYEQHRLGMPFR